MCVCVCVCVCVYYPWSSHTKDSKMVINASLLNTQRNKVRIKSKVGQTMGKG